MGFHGMAYRRDLFRTTSLHQRGRGTLMREPSTEQLEQDSRLLELARDDCEHLIGMVDDERLDLEISDYRKKAALDTLEQLSDVFNHRETQISEQLEARSNQAMDRFVQKQRKQ